MKQEDDERCEENPAACATVLTVSDIATSTSVKVDFKEKGKKGKRIQDRDRTEKYEKRWRKEIGRAPERRVIAVARRVRNQIHARM